MSGGDRHDRDLVHRLLKLSPRQRLDELADNENFFRRAAKAARGQGK
jgi:hypothetical protein